MTAQLETIPRQWDGETVVVAAPGPSLTADVAERCRGLRTVAVQDAYRLMPWADVLYGCDAQWWEVHRGAPDFEGERWASHGTTTNANEGTAAKYGVKLVDGKGGNTFSRDPSVLHYGNNSGFQAVNLALLFGASRVVLVGFDMRAVEGKRHFFGDHPKPLRQPVSFGSFIRAFETAAKSLPDGVRIINSTPGSALACFPFKDIEAALHDAARNGRGLLHQEVEAAA